LWMRRHSLGEDKRHVLHAYDFRLLLEPTALFYGRLLWVISTIRFT